MWCNQIFSLISLVEGKNTIQNLIVCDNYEVANNIAKLNYGESAFAVDTTLTPVKIGNTYLGGLFYDGESIVLPNPATDQKLSVLEIQQAELAIDTDYRLSLIELGLV